MKYLLTLFVVVLLVTCQKEDVSLELVCEEAFPEAFTPAEYSVNVQTSSFTTMSEKSVSDFTLSFYIDKSLSFTEAALLIKGSVDELKRLGWTTRIPDGVIYKLDTLPKFSNSTAALSYFRSIRSKLTHNSTFCVYLTKQKIGGIAYVLGRSKNVLPMYDMAIIGVTGNRALDVFTILHELGHDMGSRHTHDCVWNKNNTAIDACGGAKCKYLNEPGSIMSYCGQAWRNPYYHPQTLDTMRANLRDISIKFKYL